MSARVGARAALILLIAVGCAESRSAPSTESEAPADAPGVVELVCERDGGTVLSSTVVAARADGVHLVVDNRYDEPVSVAGFDADPGITRWTLGIAPGPYEVMCWPFTEHGDGQEPESLTIEVLDPETLYVPRAQLECDTDEQWTTIADYVDTAVGVDADPIAAARSALGKLEPTDALAVRDSGYPEEDDYGTSVVVSRDGRVIAIVGLSLAEDGRWYSPSSEGCAAAWPG